MRRRKVDVCLACKCPDLLLYDAIIPRHFYEEHPDYIQKGLESGDWYCRVVADDPKKNGTAIMFHNGREGSPYGKFRIPKDCPFKLEHLLK